MFHRTVSQPQCCSAFGKIFIPRFCELLGATHETLGPFFCPTQYTVSFTDERIKLRAHSQSPSASCRAKESRFDVATSLNCAPNRVIMSYGEAVRERLAKIHSKMDAWGGTLSELSMHFPASLTSTAHTLEREHTEYSTDLLAPSVEWFGHQPLCSTALHSFHFLSHKPTDSTAKSY